MERQQQQRALRECRAELEQCNKLLSSHGPSQTQQLLLQRIRHSRHRIKHLHLAIAASKHQRKRQHQQLRSIQVLKQDIASTQALTEIESEQNSKLGRISALLRQQISQTQLKIQQAQTQQKQVDFSLRRQQQHQRIHEQLNQKHKLANQIEEETVQIETMRSKAAKEKMSTLLQKKKQVAELEEQLCRLESQIQVQRDVIKHIVHREQIISQQAENKAIFQGEYDETQQEERLNAFEAWEISELVARKKDAERREILKGHILRQRSKSLFMGRIKRNQRHSYNYSAHPLQEHSRAQPLPEESTAPQTPAPVNRLSLLEKGKRIRTRETYRTELATAKKANGRSLTEPSQALFLKFPSPPQTANQQRKYEVIKVVRNTARQKKVQGLRGSGMQLA